MAYVLVVKRYAPFESFGGGFHGDGRNKASFSGSARTIAEVPFDETGLTGEPNGYSSGTLHPSTGATEYFSQVRVSISNLVTGDGSVSFTVHSAGSNPHPITGYGTLAPDIDTYVDFMIEFRDRSVAVSGVVRGDTFPNAEVFLQPPDFKIVTLDHYETTGGRNTGPFTRLAGDNSSEILSTFRRLITR